MNQAPATTEKLSSSVQALQLPKISIITPSYNQAGFLERCITSVLNQAYPSIEYIIIDGGSTDESVDIIKKYEEQLTFWISESDAGQSDAINKGFRMASGEVVAWLNSDDFYLPGAFAAVAEAYRRSPIAAFYYGDGWRTDEAGQPKCSYYPNEPICFNRDALVFGINYILQPATFINRACLVSIDYLDPHLHYGMDTDLWIRLSQVAPPVRVPAWLAASREYGKTKTSTGSFRRVEELRQIAEKHSALSITPGVICYFLDTLHQFVREQGDVFPKSYQSQVETFWAATAQLMIQYGAHPDNGFPINPTALFNQIIELGDRLRVSEKDRAAQLDAMNQLSAQLDESEADRAARLDAMNQLSAQLDESEADRAARLDVINRLSAQLDESEADRAARLDVINRLSAQLDESEADRAARLDVINRLSAQLNESEADRAARLAVMQQRRMRNKRLPTRFGRAGANLLAYVGHILRRV